MSRPSAPTGRSLTLTEELEKLEQSITLTLQEIDRNFSKAHRIVTTNILPLVEQYGEHSKNVWEASKFWKQFFEASANVSLSGYEELAEEADETTQQEETTALDETATDYGNITAQADTTITKQEYEEEEQQEHRPQDESLLLDYDDDGESMAGSTPRVPKTKSLRPQIQKFDSPYEKLRREYKGANAVFKDDLIAAAGDDDEDTMELPDHATRTRLPDMSMTPRSSSLLCDDPDQSAAAYQKPKDLLLHRVLDKNYRLQATPHKTVPSRGRSPAKSKPGAGPTAFEDNEDKTRRALWADSPQSSPEMAVPTLRSDLYMSPVRLRGQRAAPATPGVSVQTPVTSKKRDIFAGVRDTAGKGKGPASGGGKKSLVKDEITWESDDEDEGMFGGMSPPKTIQFALPPSKLMQTPAREASRRIVDDILITAGAAPEDSSEYSPTVVKMNQDILDDTF
ncbi:DASH complex subunit Ask1-domain-containing protein [Biscogniauxia mediterranea]|nr:DASH complex subunit Ask1-domain-containing protein [Biscogniauxia mediterranea]